MILRYGFYLGIPVETSKWEEGHFKGMRICRRVHYFIIWHCKLHAEMLF